jgi:ABC-type antimicrobial peptide transport system permease subunit
MFDTQRRDGYLTSLFSILSVLISCLGLFGLVTYIAESKIKEIGIRKVFGATVGNLIVMLIKEFLILVTISALIAFPLAYYWINQMLQDYAYRISIGWEIFAISLFITLCLTLTTVGRQAFKAATANPVKAIKNE